MAVNMTAQSNIRDYLLGLDDIGRPKVVDMLDIKSGKMNSAVVMISRLLYLRKGTYMDQPDMGIDIVGRYRFSFADELNYLNSDIKKQVETYLPEFAPITVKCEFQWINKVQHIIIFLNIDKTAYELVYNVESNTILGLESMG